MRFSFRVYDLNYEHIFSYHEMFHKKDDRNKVAYKIYKNVETFYVTHKNEFPAIIEVWKYNVSSHNTRKLMCVANYDEEQKEGFSIAFTNEFMKTLKAHPLPKPERNHCKRECEMQRLEDLLDIINDSILKKDGDEDAGLLS